MIGLPVKPNILSPVDIEVFHFKNFTLSLFEEKQIYFFPIKGYLLKLHFFF